MGALWGAVAGGAKAAKEYNVRRQDAEISEAKSASDEARAIRLEKIRQKHQTAERTGRQTYQTGEREAGEGFKAGESALERGEKVSQKEMDRQFEAVQTDKKIKGREDVAKIQAASREKVAKTGATGSGSGDYQSVKIKTATMTEEGFEEEENPIVFQKSTGKYFEDKGGQLIPYQLEEHLDGPQAALLQYSDKYPKEALTAYLKTKEGQRLGVPEWYKMAYGNKP